MNHKRLIGVTLASALVLSLATTALATGGGGVVTPGERAANGDTTISIMQATIDPQNVSFTVPLYVTMAVADGSAAVTVPGNYGITNTTPAGTGAADATNIGVTAMSFEKLDGSTFDTVAYTETVTGEKNLALTIGGVDMPALSQKGTETVDLTITSSRPGSTNAFWDSTLNTGAGGVNPIRAGTTLDLPLAGTVANTARTASAAVAQFKVKYTISLLNTTGAPLGWVYVGDDRTQAGLAPYTPAP